MLIVTAIEAGPIERQVCLLAESMRIAGGAFSSFPILAVVPRFGPSLSTLTRTTLRRLNVEIAHLSRNDGMSWFQFLNKTCTLKFAAQRYSGSIAWLDADIIALDEPNRLITIADFAASATDKNIGTSNDNDLEAPYFRAACETVGVDFESLPYITTETEKVGIRSYWNAGVFAFKAASGLAETYDEFTRRLVVARVGSIHCGLYMSDQVALGLAAHKLSLTIDALPMSHNQHIQPDTAADILQSDNDIRLLHYHGCMWGAQSFQDMHEGLSMRNPEIGDLLERARPTLNDGSVTTKIYRKLLSLRRDRMYKAASQEATIY